MKQDKREATDDTLGDGGLPGLPTVDASVTAELPPAPAPDVEESPADPPRADPTPRRKSHKRKKTTEPPPPPPAGPSPEEMGHLSTALGAGFDTAARILAASRGAHWLLSERERQTLGDAWAPALAPYLGAAGAYLPLLLAAVVTVGVVLPRVQQDAQQGRVSPGPVPLEVSDAELSAATTTIDPPPPSPLVPDVVPIEPPKAKRGGAR